MFVCIKRLGLFALLACCWISGTSMVDGCSVTDSSGQTFSAQEFADQTEGVEYNAADDSLSCGGFSRPCEGVMIRNCATLSCGIWACGSTSMIDIQNIVCAEYGSCEGSRISSAVSVKCSGHGSCSQVSFINLAADANLEFSGPSSGVDTSGVENCNSVLCGSGGACQNVAITNVTYVDCTASGACWRSTISNATQVNCDAQAACREAMFVDLPDNGGVNCPKLRACERSVIRKSDNVAGDNILVHCAGPYSCSSPFNPDSFTQIDVGEGTVVCEEGYFFFELVGACIYTSITSGCLECDGEKSCIEGCIYSNSTVQNITCPQDSRAGNCGVDSFDFLVGPCDHLSCGTGGFPLEDCDEQVNRCETPDFGASGDRCEAPVSSSSNRALASAKGKKKSEKKGKSKKNKKNKERMEVIPGCSCAFPLD